MVSKVEKRLAKMRIKQSGWRRVDVDGVYEYFGFIINSGGNHDKVYHPDYPQLVTFLPRHRKMGEYIINQLIKKIDQLEKLQNQSKESKDD